MTVAICNFGQSSGELKVAQATLRALVLGASMLALAACATSGGGGGRLPNDIPSVSDPAPIVSGTMRPYTIRGRTYRPSEQRDYNQTGMASWYGQYHQGRPTSSGERFDMNALTAAHKTLPLPSMVEVTNPANGRRVLLRVNDRGPFVDSRIIDLSRSAADELGLLSQGVGEVRVRYVGPAPRAGGGIRLADVGGRAPAPTIPPVADRRTASAPAARPYNEVLRESAATATTQAAAAPTPRRRGYEGIPTARNVPIPQQPLPPAMPTRDAVVAQVSPPAQEVERVPVQAAPPVAPTGATYRVQVITFDEKPFADGVARQLGASASVESFQRNGRALYRVVVGPWADEASAERSRQAVIARGFGEALLIGN